MYPLARVLLCLQRKASQAASGGCKNRIRHGRSNWWHAWLAHPARLVSPRHNVHLDLRHLRKGKDGVVFEVCLHHLTAFDDNFALERGRKTKCDGPFHLGSNEVGVHTDAAVDRADDAMHVDCTSMADRDLSDLGDIAPKRMINGDAAMLALGYWRPPAGFFGCEFKDCPVSRSLAQQFLAERERVGCGRMGELINEALDDEGIL